MRGVARLFLVMTCCALVLVAACSDSTSPAATLDPAHVAAHIDSLYVAALAKGAPNEDDLAFLEIAPALGARPADITVISRRGTEFWRGFVLEIVRTSHGVPTDSTYLITAYRDSNASTILTVEFDGDGTYETGSMVTDSTIELAAAHGTGTIARASIGDACATPSSSLTSPYVTFFATMLCSSATFTSSATIGFPDLPDLDPALLSFTISSTAFDGVRILDE